MKSTHDPRSGIARAVAQLGVKEIGWLLNLTTTRVYQLRAEGTVRKIEQAQVLAERTGIPIVDFLVKPKGGGPRHTNGRPNALRRGRGRERSRFSSSPGASAPALKLASGQN